VLFTIRFERLPKVPLSGWYELEVLSIETSRYTLHDGIIRIAGKFGRDELYWKVCFRPVEAPAVRIWDRLVIYTPHRKRFWKLKKTVQFLIAAGLRAEEDEKPLKEAEEIAPDMIEGRRVWALVKPKFEEPEQKERILRLTEGKPDSKDLVLKWYHIREYRGGKVEVNG